MKNQNIAIVTMKDGRDLMVSAWFRGENNNADRAKFLDSEDVKDCEQVLIKVEDLDSDAVIEKVVFTRDLLGNFMHDLASSKNFDVFDFVFNILDIAEIAHEDLRYGDVIQLRSLFDHLVYAVRLNPLDSEIELKPAHNTLRLCNVISYETSPLFIIEEPIVPFEDDTIVETVDAAVCEIIESLSNQASFRWIPTSEQVEQIAQFVRNSLA